eukprot:438398_1
MGNNNSNQKHLSTLHIEDDDKKSNENEMEYMKRRSMTYNPFDYSKQEKVKQLFENEIKPKHNITLTGTKLTEWISSYLSEEKYRSDIAIREDLNDPYFSHLKETMENELQNDANQETINEIYNILKDEIFNENYNNNNDEDDDYSINDINDINENRSSIIVHDNTVN